MQFKCNATDLIWIWITWEKDQVRELEHTFGLLTLMSSSHPLCLLMMMK